MLEARISPQPSPKSTRAPSTSITSWSPGEVLHRAAPRCRTSSPPSPDSEAPAVETKRGELVQPRRERSRRCGRRWRSAARRRRARRRSRSSSSPNMMWPDSSPASSASSCLHPLLDQRVAGRDMIGTPPAASSTSGSACEHFTSKTTFCPGPCCSIRSSAVEEEQGVAAHDPAAVVDRADAVRVAVEGHAQVRAGLLHLRRCRSTRFLSTTGSGWWFGKVPSDSQKIGITSTFSPSAAQQLARRPRCPCRCRSRRPPSSAARCRTCRPRSST